MDSKKQKNILNITFISLFAALSYIALMLFFFPVGIMYVHFGNLIVVLAALLIGGWQGGLAGSIGMGLYDIFNGHADSSPKTFLLKFLIGLTVGIIFTFLNNRKKYPSLWLLISGLISLVISIFLIVFGNKNNFKGDISILAPIFIVIGILCIIFSLLKNKFSQKTASAIVGASCGMLVNIVGETLWKTFQFWIAGSSFAAAFTGAALAQGSTLINAGIAIIGGVALYSVLQKPFSKILNK
ncbi:MAG: ECF transporter S component [Clostridia bacterium]|nr:ECF transporter S component [Clostridia bacterium]